MKVLFYIIISFLHKSLIKLVLNERRPARYDDERDEINVPSTFISVEIQTDCWIAILISLVSRYISTGIKHVMCMHKCLPFITLLLNAYLIR